MLLICTLLSPMIPGAYSQGLTSYQQIARKDDRAGSVEALRRVAGDRFRSYAKTHEVWSGVGAIHACLRANALDTKGETQRLFKTQATAVAADLVARYPKQPEVYWMRAVLTSKWQPWDPREPDSEEMVTLRIRQPDGKWREEVAPLQRYKGKSLGGLIIEKSMAALFRLNPDFPEAVYSEAFQKKDLDTRIAWFKRAWEGGSDYMGPGAAYHISLAYRKKGNVAEASRWMNIVRERLRKDPKSVSTRIFLKKHGPLD